MNTKFRTFFYLVLIVTSLCIASVSFAASKRALCIGSGSSSGAWYVIGGGIANAINLTSKAFTVTCEAASGGGENLRNLKAGNIELAMLNCDMGYYYYTSTDSYMGKGSDKLRSLVALPSSAMHIVIKGNLNIKSVADLKGKRVAVGRAGSGYESFARKVINCAGLTYKDMTVQMINPAQMPEAMKNGQIDAFFFPVQIPGSAITELFLTADVKLLPLSEEFIKKFQSEYVGYVNYNIQKNTYTTQNAAVDTLATGQFISTDRDILSPDDVYTLMHDIFDNRDKWLSAHTTCKEITDTNIGSLIVPLHAGAVKFYAERGVQIPTDLVPPEAK